ncbi:ABC transporter ATP-binding protein [Conexibacter woesei]|uniref:Oligopeptide/dipeptide ABC transporter, ATPase subunit n=1 Tax=Conexibacter woesei (strain DSM 14684 / CCUG 47730 / CIP 108061 / JCM 11494 / NBRC 100937 / ID131577) TaxID=469383 RepID=D3F6I1_CONWI|nr:ABC transporter ATP-binding protein [Conexibacter woesei]ADB50748.1 oligopeptide/dipeptide ABC transporter, ATPase subunit [Conexibacter woesei DSM 14684]
MTAAAANPCASVRDLHVTLTRRGRDVRALRGVDLEIAPGEVVALVGESGSGKSVLGLALLGLLPAAARPRATGSVIVRDFDMLGPEPQRRRARRSALGAVFQDPSSGLDPTMTIGRQLREAVGDAGADPAELLERVGLDARTQVKRFPHQLSGGQRQRVMFALAIARGPALVIADEPTTALDVTVQAHVLDLVGTLRDELGCSFLFITHDLGVAARIADRAVVLYAGRHAESAPTRQLVAQPRHPYTRGLLASRIEPDATVATPLRPMGGGLPDPTAPPPGCAFASRCPSQVEACLTVLPQPQPVGEGRLVACLRADERQALADPAPLPPHEPRPRTDEHVLRLVGVAKQFAGARRLLGTAAAVRALEPTSLDVRRGEAVAIVGESGSGKSTLVRIAAGLERPDAGSVEREGSVQMVFQDAGGSLTPWATVGQLLAERARRGGVPSGEVAGRTRTALTRVGLSPDVLDQRAGELSGGQRQRVALARAVLVPPATLLCDEPTSALDVSLVATVLQLLRAVRDELGMAIVLVTHDLAVAAAMANRVVVMRSGRVVEQGDARDVLRRPQHEYTRTLLAAVPTLAAAGTGSGGVSLEASA